MADDFSLALSHANEQYGKGNITDAHYWYLKANESASSYEQLRKTLPALAVTSINLNRPEENLRYLREFQRISPDDPWISQHVEDFSIILPDDFYEQEKTIPPVYLLVILFLVAVTISSSGKKKVTKSKNIKSKASFNLASVFSSISRTASGVNKLRKVVSNKPPVFISYSRKDIRFLNELKQHLAVYERQGLIEYWDDSKIEMGMLWRLEIKHALSSAQVAILLVSGPYLASKFIVSNELPPLLRSAKGRNTEIIPIMVSHCAYDISEVGKIQASNSLSKPLKDLSPSDRDKQYLKVLDKVAGLLSESV